MFYGILITVHILICLFLIGIVLVQAGRGGGLAEGFSQAESIFGSKTNTFLTKTTTVLAVLFFVTCLSLAFVSKQRSKSLLEGRTPAQTKQSQSQLPTPPSQHREPADSPQPPPQETNKPPGEPTAKE